MQVTYQCLYIKQFADGTRSAKFQQVPQTDGTLVRLPFSPPEFDMPVKQGQILLQKTFTLTFTVSDGSEV